MGNKLRKLAPPGSASPPAGQQASASEKPADADHNNKADKQDGCVNAEDDQQTTKVATTVTSSGGAPPASAASHDDDEPAVAPPPRATTDRRPRRGAVSAEVYNEDDAANYVKMVRDRMAWTARRRWI